MLTVAVLEFVQFFLAVKEGRYPVRLGQCRFVDVLQLAHEVHEGYRLGIHASQGRANSDVDLGIFRSNDLVRRQVKGLGELFAKLGQVGQRTAEEANRALMGRPQARPVMVWNTIDWNTEAATFSLLAPSFKSAGYPFSQRRRSGLQ